MQSRLTSVLSREGDCQDLCRAWVVIYGARVDEKIYPLPAIRKIYKMASLTIFLPHKGNHGAVELHDVVSLPCLSA